MTDEELIEDIAWLHGGHDQGQRDDDRKDRVTLALHTDGARALRVLTAYTKRLLEPPFTLEDVSGFISFLDWYLGYSI